MAMNRFKNKIAYIVPTKDHPEDLRKLLISVREQTSRPEQFIIVDGGDREVKDLLDDFKDLQIDYCRVRPPGLTRQRNAGKKLLRPEITLAGYLDDDIVMEKDANERMLEYFENVSPDHGGASFYITNNPVIRQNLLKRIFLLDDGRKGVILGSGMNSTAYSLEADLYVEWLCGGATVWRREILDSLTYDENYRGYGHFDDLDFSCRIGQEYRLKVLANARVAHYYTPIRMERNYAYGVLDVVNRFYFVRKFPGRFSVVQCLWATIGMTMLYFLLFLKKRDKGLLLRCGGFIAGIYKVCTGSQDTIETNIK